MSSGSPAGSGLESRRSVLARGPPAHLRGLHRTRCCRAAAGRREAAPAGHRSAIRHRARLRVARSRGTERLRARGSQLHEAPDRGPHTRPPSPATPAPIGRRRSNWCRACRWRTCGTRAVFTREVLNGLERIGFLYPQQIIWNKGRVVFTRTHYWYQHEPCWYVRKKNAPGTARPGRRTPRSGTRRRRSSSWADRTKRSSIIRLRSPWN